MAGPTIANVRQNELATKNHTTRMAGLVPWTLDPVLLEALELTRRLR
jgi:hypothetical protein